MRKIPEQYKQYYDIEKRGSEAPEYSPAELKYRNERLSELSNAWVIREQPLMELNNVPYSQYDLTNFQTHLAFNPPKVNPGDSRYVTGYVREKDLTIKSIIMDMNLQPQFTPFDKTDKKLIDVSNIFTAKVKKTLEQMNFRDRMENMIDLLVSRGNVFARIQKQEKWCVEKKESELTENNNPNLNEPVKWKTIYKKEYDYCSIDVLPNTAIFPMNIRQENITGENGQARVYTVRHYPVSEVARIYSKNPRWKSVPKTPTMTIPDIVNGIWGDYYLKLPATDYVEVITMESEAYNEYQVWLNGVQMLPVQEEDGLISGYPLSKVSPSGRTTICKGDYERIPFFFFSKSNPDKNFVKEEELNEVGRLMILMLRQKTQPSIGNNTNRVIQPNIWNPNMVISDVKKDDLHILKPNDGINQSEFSFYKLLQDSIDDSSVSKSLEGSQTKDMTLGQYTDQKKENLKKIGLSIDRVIDFLKQVYWKVLDNEISYLDQKISRQNEDGTFEEAYQSFSIEDTIDGRKGNIQVNLMDDTESIDPYEEAKKEAEMEGEYRSYYANPKELQDIYKRMRDKIKCTVISQPEGQEMSLLGMLLNVLTQYTNLGGNNQRINFDYIETIIAENSGFDPNKIFIEQTPDEKLAEQQQKMMESMGVSNPKSSIPQNLNLKTITDAAPVA